MRNAIPILTALLISACATPADPSLRAQGQAATVANGSSLNGSSLNGSSLNGSSLNGSDLGTTLVSVALAGAKIPVGTLDTVSLDGTVFHGTLGSASYSGTDFAGAKFDGFAGDGTPVKVKIADVHPGEAPNPDVWQYDVVYKTGGGAWTPLCVDRTGATRTAIPLMGVWDYRQGVTGGGSKIDDPDSFTFACTGMSAIAKCVMLGYEPWTSVGGVPLADYHEACTRLIRADYCGDGTSYTVDGQWVDVYDALGIQRDDELWVPEAEWDAAGARCFNPDNRSHELLPCYDFRVMPGCGDPADFLLGTLLIDETPPL